MPTYVFKFGEMFPADDPLSEWAATVALAFDDLSLVHDRLGDDEAVPYRWLYWLRLGIAHFAEAADFVRKTETIPAVAEFIDSLPAKAQEHHCEFIRLFEKHKTVIERIRNEAGFHYPGLTVVPNQRRKRPMQKVLGALAEESARVEGKTIGDARFLYADDVASALVLRAHGSPEAIDATSLEQMKLLGAAHIEIEEAIAAWVLFVNDALDAYFRRGIKRGASWQREGE